MSLDPAKFTNTTISALRFLLAHGAKMVSKRHTRKGEIAEHSECVERSSARPLSTASTEQLPSHPRQRAHLTHPPPPSSPLPPPLLLSSFSSLTLFFILLKYSSHTRITPLPALPPLILLHPSLRSPCLLLQAYASPRTLRESQTGRCKI